MLKRKSKNENVILNRKCNVTHAVTRMCQDLSCGLNQKLKLGLGQNLNLGPQPEPEPVPGPELGARLSSVLSLGLSLLQRKSKNATGILQPKL